MRQFDSKQYQKSKTKPDDAVQGNSESDIPKIFTYLIPNENTLRPHKSLPKTTALTPTHNSSRHANSDFHSEAEKKYDSSGTTPKNQTTLPNTNNQALTPTSASTNQVVNKFVDAYDQKKFQQADLKTHSNLFFQRKIKNASESMKLFSYLETKQTNEFLQMARTCKMKFKNCINEKLQTLMHVAAMTGDAEVARFLRSKNCLGENKDVVYC